MGARRLDLDTVVDGQKLSRVMILVVGLAMLTLISDGFDLASMGYIAPELLKDWHIPPARLVPAFSSGIVGMMVGGPVLGILGDRYGRKRVAVLGLCGIGFTTLATMAVRSTTDLVALRLLTGVALGGVIPNIVALVAELTPRRIRARLLVVVTMGVALGIALPGMVAATLVPLYGWRIILVVGGVAPIAIALATMALIPESIKYLMERGGRGVEVRRIAKLLRPDLELSENVVVVAPKAATDMRPSSPKMLFVGDFRFVTPLLWICQAANQMANFFSLTWLPILLQSSGASTAQAGIAASLFAFGGLAGGFVLLVIIDRLGVFPLLVLFFVGAPLVALMGAKNLSPVEHMLVIACAGLCVTGIQFGLTALLGIFYPTSVRSMGTGWTQAAGRVGALAAPVAGGILLAMHMNVHELVLAPAIILLVGGLACGILAYLCVQKLGGTRPSEFAMTRTPSEAVLLEAAGRMMRFGRHRP